ncbi:7728_t:CDS:1, partial [Gigaspora margarita]
IIHKHVIAFHTIEKAHSIKDRSTEKTIKLHEENFEKSSCQMEHYILITVLNEVEPYLDKYEFVLEIVVNGALDTNRALANMQIVS